MCFLWLSPVLSQLVYDAPVGLRTSIFAKLSYAFQIKFKVDFSLKMCQYAKHDYANRHQVKPIAT